MISQVLSAVAEEFTASWMRTGAEWLQFALLVGIIWIVAFGFGKRRGFVLNMLDEYKHSVADRVEHAQKADAVLGTATTEAEQSVTTAREDAKRLVEVARTESTEQEERARKSADDEAARIVERAQTALANEREQMCVDLRDELVELVSEATRLVMNESLTVAEQRERIEKAVAASMEAPRETARGKVRAIAGRSAAKPA